MNIRGDSRRDLWQVEREARSRIWLLFAVLIAIVFVSIYLIAWMVSLIAFFFVPLAETFRFVTTPFGVLRLFTAALVIAPLYWWSAQRGAHDRLLSALKARPLDPLDVYHQRLAAVVEEMRIASGAPPIECVVVPTIGMNAFAFSDLKGHAVIGVTEGSLARLSRPQLEGVVAHEMAHILSGSYVTVTVACLLFGIYSAWMDGVSSSALDATLVDAPIASAAAGPAGATIGVMTVLIGLMQFLSAIVNAAISRTREEEADAAAARYTRDPVSLAQALRTIARHPGGAGYIPTGLAPLCIRPASFDLGRLLATHPPTQERIARLLHLADMGPEEFMGQAEEADSRFAQREHVSQAPGQRTQADLRLDATVVGAKPSAEQAITDGAAAAGQCPTCQIALSPVRYEGVVALVCRSCGGRLVDDAAMGRILARREIGFTPEQERLADQVASEGNLLRKMAIRKRGSSSANPIACPHCRRTMARRFYDYTHAVEVDVCMVCATTWFDKDELEVLQVLLERQVQ